MTFFYPKSTNMKKLFVLPFFLLILVSCQDKETLEELNELKATAELEEQNKALIEKYIEAWNAKDMQVFDEVLDPQFKILVPSNSPDPMSLEQHKAWIEGILQGFPDIHYAIQDLVAEGDRVSLRWTCTATFQSEDPEAEKQILGSCIELYKIREGKIIEERSEMDALGWNQQVGYTLVMDED
jgi:predicted ester cyclase